MKQHLLQRLTRTARAVETGHPDYRQHSARFLTIWICTPRLPTAVIYLDYIGWSAWHLVAHSTSQSGSSQD